MLLLWQNPPGASCAIPNKVSLNAFLDLSALYSLHVLPNLPPALQKRLCPCLFHSFPTVPFQTQWSLANSKAHSNYRAKSFCLFPWRLLPLLSCSLYSHFRQDCTQLLRCQGGLFWLPGLNHHQKNQNISHRVGVFSLFRKRNFSNSLILCPILNKTTMDLIQG